MFEGTVQDIFIGPDPQGPMRRVDEIKAIAGRGLEGDRYAGGAGTFSENASPGSENASPGSENAGPGREVTLIEAEAIDAVGAESGLELSYDEPRRNIVTRGVPLNHLVGREFLVGSVRLRGVRLCEPCKHLATLTGKSLVQPLLHRAGLRADIVEGGVVRTGDRVTET